MTCKCVTTRQLVDLTMQGHEVPECPEHDGPDPASGATDIALNDDAALTSAISRALGIPADAITTIEGA